MLPVVLRVSICKRNFFSELSTSYFTEDLSSKPYGWKISLQMNMCSNKRKIHWTFDKQPYSQWRFFSQSNKWEKSQMMMVLWKELYKKFCRIPSKVSKKVNFARERTLLCLSLTCLCFVGFWYIELFPFGSHSTIGKNTWSVRTDRRILFRTSNSDGSASITFNEKCDNSCRRWRNNQAWRINFTLSRQITKIHLNIPDKELLNFLVFYLLNITFT